MSGSVGERAGQLAAPVIPVLGESQGWLVGGTVRDLLLGKVPVDIDVAATDAEGVAARFAAAHRVSAARMGRELGTFRVPIGDTYYDFAPVQGETILDDLGRRDYTVNALAIPLHLPGCVEDPFGGEADLRAHTVRMVHASNLIEDPLRTLRGLRFAVALDARIEENTWEAIRDGRRAMDGVAAERIQHELERMLRFSPGAAVTLLARSGYGDLLLGCGLEDRVLRATGRIPAGDDAQLHVLAVAATLLQVDDVGGRMRERRWSTAAAERTARLAARAASDWLGPANHVLELQQLEPRDARGLVVILRALQRDEEATRLAEFLAQRDHGWWQQRPLLGGDEVREVYGLSGPALGEALRELLVLQLRGEVSSAAEAHAAMARISRSG